MYLPVLGRFLKRRVIALCPNAYRNFFAMNGETEQSKETIKEIDAAFYEVKQGSRPK